VANITTAPVSHAYLRYIGRPEYFTMSRSLLSLGRRIHKFPDLPQTRLSQSTIRMTSNLNSSTISNITEKEKELTGSERPVKGGPTAQAQKHAGETISSSAVSDIAQGERKITGEPTPVQGGPAATAQSHLSGVSSTYLAFESPHLQLTSSSTHLTYQPPHRYPNSNLAPEYVQQPESAAAAHRQA
jgi:hypothetical protein